MAALTDMSWSDDSWLLVACGSDVDWRVVTSVSANIELLPAPPEEGGSRSTLITHNCPNNICSTCDNNRRQIVLTPFPFCSKYIARNSLECCSEHQAVYRLNVSRSSNSSVVLINSSISSADIVTYHQCYHDNCTCDSNSSSDNQQIILILGIICTSLFILVLLTLCISCYKWATEMIDL